MSYGLVGAHRTGKTTLAQAFSKETNITFVQTSTSAVMARHGFDPKLNYPLIDRLHIQNIILDEMDIAYRSAPRTFITDRTPIDAAAYLLADITRADTIMDHQVLKYMARCFAITNEHFSMLLLLQPGIPLVEEEGKAPANPAYIEHISQLCMGLLNDERVGSKHFYCPRRYLRLEDRVMCLGNAVKRAHERSGIELETFVNSGGVLQ